MVLVRLLHPICNEGELSLSKMNPCRLANKELIYELWARGIRVPETRAEKRSALRVCFQGIKLGCQVLEKQIVNSDSEFESCKEKIRQLR